MLLYYQKDYIELSAIFPLKLTMVLCTSPTSCPQYRPLYCWKVAYSRIQPVFCDHLKGDQVGILQRYLVEKYATTLPSDKQSLTCPTVLLDVHAAKGWIIKYVILQVMLWTKHIIIINQLIAYSWATTASSRFNLMLRNIVWLCWLVITLFQLSSPVVLKL